MRSDRAPRSPARAFCLMASLLVLGPFASGAAHAESATDPAAITARAFDAAVLRPLGAVRLLAGAALWVPISVVQAVGDLARATGAPMGLSSGADGDRIRESFDLFVGDPADYVFTRPLGKDLGSG
ncbi:MAG: hypothetical protein R3F16_05225 [Myxococcota bacterium]